MSDFIPSFVPPDPGAGPGTHQSRFETNPIARDRLPDGELSFSFEDLLDTINPLQQIPGVNWIYRAITGDQIALGPRLIGGALFGGPLGVLLAGIQAGLEEMSGTAKDGGPIVAMVRDIIGPANHEPADGPPGTDVPKGEVVIELAPAAAAVQPPPAPALIESKAPEPLSAAAAMPRPQPMNLPRGWTSPQSRGSLVSPTSFHHAPSPVDTKPTQPTSVDPDPIAAWASTHAGDHTKGSPNATTPDWVPSAMIQALEKYENARRLKRDDVPAVSTVQ